MIQLLLLCNVVGLAAKGLAESKMISREYSHTLTTPHCNRERLIVCVI